MAKASAAPATIAIVCGLGNPDADYERTRHNAGFATVDVLAARHGVRYWKSEAGAQVASLTWRGADGERWILEDNIGEMLECCAQLLEPRGAFLVLNLYSMGLSSTLARTAVRQAFGAPREEQWGELCFTDRAGKQLPLGTYYRFTR